MDTPSTQITLTEVTHCDGNDSMRLEPMTLKQYFKYIQDLHELEDMAILSFKATRTLNEAYVTIWQ